jgi:DNA sulfur modification protein DndB
MKLAVPTHGKKTVKMGDLVKWEGRGWKFHKEISSTACEIRKKYSGWETFEIELRLLFKEAGFSDVIDDVEDFHYTELGPQLDVCGGVDQHFLIIDCTESLKKQPVNLKQKLRENHAKRERILKALQKKYPDKYKQVVTAVCVRAVDPSGADVRESEHLAVPIIDVEFFHRCVPYLSTFGSALRYQILKRLGVGGVSIDGPKQTFFEFPAVVIQSGAKMLYSFCATPENLLRLAYVKRLDRFAESGYQRDLNAQKLRHINGFLSGDGYFANNLVVCFDGGNGHLTFLDAKKRAVKDPQQGQMGLLRIPKVYCSAEVIDGQHRLFGYLNVTGDAEVETRLALRRAKDALNVIAIEDPGEDERPLLFVDINCDQTRVSMRNIWSLMGDIKPNFEMGFIANLVKALNGKGPLKGKIHVPGKNTQGGRAINIANLGKGIKDRHLVTFNRGGAKFDWNVYDGPHEKESYPDHSSEVVLRDFNTFFSALKSTAPHDWKRQEKGFILTNNGLNVLLRVFTEILKSLRQRNTVYKPGTLKKFLGREVGEFIEDRTPRSLRGQSSSEDGRAKIAKALWERLAKKNKLGQ